MTNKEKAISFLQMAGSGNVRSAYEKYIATNFIHHNQYFKGDRNSLLTAMEEAHKSSPNKTIEVKQVFEEGNTVITHSLVTRQNPAEPDIAVVHIFRFEGDLVAELWDLGQLLSKESPNENGAF
ncbi:nuclear transport factor 2 family protein [Leptospira sanjuanensis]|uniref:nuclear transport factor 2 family protein n=1 Tax=Leptospira sanjuanensis TaxID=2879643 RepID=UPI001EE7DBF7|nr:nuclear transport factor 2 family protein [Leptospira sanjuanensis]MCG6167350.1 nuclear transport factor 2 family protein [Leptospira sanjuanensis]